MCNERKIAFLGYLTTRDDIELVGEYINSRTPTDFRCLYCLHRWPNTPGNIKNNQNGCPKCARFNNQEKKRELARADFEAYVKSFKTLTIKSEYINSTTSVTLGCNICSNEFDVIPSDFKRGQKCSFCSENQRNEKYYKRLLERLKKINVELLDSFKGLLKDSKFLCNKCNGEWITKPDVILNSSYHCPNCTADVLDKYQEFREEFEEYISKRSDIELVGELVNSRVQALFQCTGCKEKWFAIPINLKRGDSGCKHCKNKIGHNKRTISAKERFLAYLNTKPIQIAGNFIGMSKQIDLKCEVCNHLWDTTPNMIMTNESGCPACAASERAQVLVNAAKKSFLEYLNTRQDIKMINEFVDMGTKGKFHCSLCSKEWEQSPNRIKFIESGCPYCNASKGEKAIRYYLEENQELYIYQWSDHQCIYKYPLRFDFYLPTHNLVIEFQGIQHYEYLSYFHSSYEKFEEQVYKDELKRRYCLEKNLRFLEIPYYEIERITDVLKNALDL